MKQRHFEALDGLRGVAAMAVFAFHMLELIFEDPVQNPLRHAAMAVDFFFCLSGYVMGHAYDARLRADAGPRERLTLRGFALRRLIRLQPLVVLGLLWGTVTFVANPFVGSAHHPSQLGVGKFAANVLLGLFLIPAPSILWGLTHSLNGPAWSLAQEYLANIVYGLFGSRVGKVALGVFTALSAVVLLAVALKHNTVVLGPAWRTIWAAPLRVAVSFSIGLLGSRMDLRWRIPHPFLLLSVVLMAIMASPTIPGWNGLAEWVMAVVLFPLIVVAGAGETVAPGVAGVVCRFSGRLSYPLYMMHYPFALWFADWMWKTKPRAPVMWTAFSAALVLGTLFSAAVMVWVDEPLRAWLSRVMLGRDQARVRSAVAVN